MPVAREAGLMFANLPKWFLYSLVLTALLAALMLFSGKKATLPGDCQMADGALSEGDYDLAIDHYIACIDSGDLPNRALAAAYHSLASAYSAKGNHYQAIKDYSEAIALAPTHAWAYNNRCWSYGVLRRGEEALADCDEALKLLPEQPEILDSRALAHWLLDEHAKAQQDLERAWRLDPSRPTWQERFREFEGMF
jgi:tetratricopeptide (TPR) repeat protein